MNLTGGSTLPNIGKRINWQLVTLIGGLTIAVSAAALAGAFERDGSRGTTLVASPAEAPVSEALVASDRFTSPPREFVTIVVGSEAVAGMIDSTIGVLAAASPGGTDLHSLVSIVVLDTPEKEEEFRSTTALAALELMANEASLNVVDLRHEAAPATSPWSTEEESWRRPIVYIVGSEERAQTLQADLELLSHAVQGYDLPLSQASVVVIESPSGEFLYNALLGDQMEFGTFDIIDLRP